MRNFEFYRVREGTDLGDPNTLNSVFDDVDLRLARMEETKRSWDEQVEVLVELGLERVNEVLLPAVERITRLANLGALFSAKSDTQFTPAPGPATFSIEESKRDAFAPAWYLSITSESDPSKAMAATLVSYDEETGELAVNIVRSQGGTAEDWYIAPGSATEALDVLHTAEAARDEAVAARDAVAEDWASVNDARAIVAQIHAATASARDEAVDARIAAVNARAVTTAARDEAVVARDDVTSARDATLAAATVVNTARGETLDARDDAVSARDDAVSARDDAVEARADAVLAKNDAVDARDDVATMKPLVDAAATTTVNARDATLAALESFPNWYLGAHASDPVAGPGGIALAEGMLYANTAHKQIRQYFAGTGWTVVYVPHDSTVASVFGRMGSVGAMAGDYSANQITRTTGTGGVPGGDVEAALAAIWTAKAESGHSHAAATTGAAGFMSAADKVKLNGIATGATANAADAALRERSSHTGTQAISTVAGLQSALDGKAAAAHTHAFSSLTSRPSTVAGYGITDAYTKDEVDNALGAKATGTPSTSAEISTIAQRDTNGDLFARYFRGQHLGIAHSVNTRLSDTIFYSGVDDYVRKNTAAGFKASLAITTADISGLQSALDGKAAAAHTHAFSSLTSRPTTVAGYGITNAYTKDEVDNALGAKMNIEDASVWMRANFLTRPEAPEARLALGLGSAALQPDTAFAEASHNHDDRYYTQAQINTQMGGKANSSHAHSAADLTSGTLPAARFTDASHGNRGGGTLHAAATTGAAGFMSAADKAKLNGVATGAQVNPGVAGPAMAAAGVNNTEMMTPLRTAQAIAALAPTGIGVGQTWQDVAASRAKGTAYQNSTGKPIQVVIQMMEDNEFQVSENGIDWIRYSLIRYQATMQAIIPNEHYYKLDNGTGSIGIYIWIELR